MSKDVSANAMPRGTKKAHGVDRAYDVDHEVVREVVAHLAHTQPLLRSPGRVTEEMLLCLQCYADAKHPEMYSMPAALDAAWHAFILNTRDYRAYCKKHFGRVIHHSTATSRDTEAEKEARRANLRGAYAGTHGRAPPADVWGGASALPVAVTQAARASAKRQRTEAQGHAPGDGPETMYCRTLTGKTMTFRVSLRMTDVLEFKKLIAAREGIPPAQQRIMYAGRKLADEWTLHDCGIEDGSIVYVVLKLSGC